MVFDVVNALDVVSESDVGVEAVKRVWEFTFYLLQAVVGARASGPSSCCFGFSKVFRRLFLFLSLFKA